LTALHNQIPDLLPIFDLGQFVLGAFRRVAAPFFGTEPIPIPRAWAMIRARPDRQLTTGDRDLTTTHLAGASLP
jgi:hypothetical protein